MSSQHSLDCDGFPPVLPRFEGAIIALFPQPCPGYLLPVNQIVLESTESASLHPSTHHFEPVYKIGERKQAPVWGSSKRHKIATMCFILLY